MYITTPEIRARAVDGWDALIGRSVINATVDLDPGTLTRSGQSTIRRWLRKGYCERFSGSLSAYWVGLMYIMDARFIMRDDGSTAFVRVFDPSIMGEIRKNDGQFAAMYKLMRAASPAQNGEAMMDLNVYTADEVSSATIYNTPSRLWQGNLQIYGRDYAQLRDYFIRQFGPPVEEQDHGLNLFKQVHQLQLTINQHDSADNKYPRLRTSCRVAVL